MPPRRAKKAPEDTKIVESSRFKTIRLNERISIKDLIEKNNLEFATGKGFYQLTEPETIQFDKEIVVRRKSDGVFATGDKLRSVLDIPKETVKFKVDNDKLADFDIFVQSTSHNRILLPDTDFLYDTGAESASTAGTSAAAAKDEASAEKKSETFEEEVRGRGSGGGMNRSLHQLFDTLAVRTTPYEATLGEESSLIPVNPSRFQILDVTERCDIRTFVQENSLIFKTGKGFYEFTKPEKISDKKKVVLVDKVTGDMFTGPDACIMIGAGGTGKIKPKSFEKWRVFVQSTSYNRVLMPDTGFLYEVDTDH